MLHRFNGSFGCYVEVFEDGSSITASPGLGILFITGFTVLETCTHKGWGPRVGEVTCLGGVKKNSPLHAILQPRHPGVHFLKIIEWSLSTETRKMPANHVYAHLLLLLQPSVLWLSIVTFNNYVKPPGAKVNFA